MRDKEEEEEEEGKQDLRVCGGFLGGCFFFSLAGGGRGEDNASLDSRE